MQRIQKVGIAGGLLISAVAAGILFVGLYVDFADPAFQRALLRLLAVVGFAAVLAMCASLLARVEPEDQFAKQPATHRPRRNR